MKGSGGVPTAYAGFVQQWDPADLGYNNASVPSAGVQGLPVSLLPFGQFTLYVLSAGVVTITCQLGDVDTLTLYQTIVLGSTGGNGRFSFAFGVNGPLLPGLIHRGIRFDMAATGGPFNVTALLLGRV